VFLGRGFFHFFERTSIGVFHLSRIIGSV
jgi:hypothetical protein